MNLFVTSDRIGSRTGGGLVTYHELESLKATGPTAVINPEPTADPFDADRAAYSRYVRSAQRYRLAHFYAGTYPTLAAALKADGTKVTYTAAAHDVAASRAEHEALGYKFDYPHLTDPVLFEKYLASYRAADVVICPSAHSRRVMEGFGCRNIVVVPHGVDTDVEVRPLPKRFVVGYLGQPGPDKGLRHLFKAWGMLGYRDARLVVAGRGTEHLLPLVREAGGSVHLAGFVREASWLYHSCSVYVQPSVTEGFGLEIVEAMAHGRPVVCSDGAGAADCVSVEAGRVVPAGDAAALARAIDHYKRNPELLAAHGDEARRSAAHYSWDRVRRKYQDVWEAV
jgi:glycosyltransferase involved in cell wall biosynthesis